MHPYGSRIITSCCGAFRSSIFRPVIWSRVAKRSVRDVLSSVERKRLDRKYYCFTDLGCQELKQVKNYGAKQLTNEWLSSLIRLVMLA